MPDYKSLQVPCKVAVQARLVALIGSGAIAGIDSGNVLVRPVPSFHDFGIAGAPGKSRVWPGIIVSNSAAEAETQATNASSDRGVTVLVSIGLQETTADMDALLSGEDERLAWRDAIINNLVPRGVVTVNPAIHFHRADYMGGQIVDWHQYSAQKRWVSSMNFRFWTRRHQT